MLSSSPAGPKPDSWRCTRRNAPPRQTPRPPGPGPGAAQGHTTDHRRTAAVRPRQRRQQRRAGSDGNDRDTSARGHRARGRGATHQARSRTRSGCARRAGQSRPGRKPATSMLAGVSRQGSPSRSSPTMRDQPWRAPWSRRMGPASTPACCCATSPPSASWEARGIPRRSSTSGSSKGRGAQPTSSPAVSRPRSPAPHCTAGLLMTSPARTSGRRGS